MSTIPNEEVKLSATKLGQVRLFLTAFDLGLREVSLTVLSAREIASVGKFLRSEDLIAGLDDVLAEVETKLHAIFIEFADRHSMGEVFQNYRTEVGKTEANKEERARLFLACAQQTIDKLRME